MPETTVASPAGRARVAGLSTVVMWAVLLFAVALIVYPMAIMVGRGFSGGNSWADLFSQPWFPAMLRDTTIVVGLASVFAVLIATLLVWINERTDARLGVLGDILPLIPLFLPTVATVIGWVMLANPEVGFLNKLLEKALGPLGIDFAANIYSYPGLIFVYVLITVPFAYMPILAAFRNLDPSLEEAARISGAGPWTVFRTVSIPAIAPSMFGGFVLVCVVALSLFSAPVILATKPGIEILAVRIVYSVRGAYPPAYDFAAMLSLIMLAVLLALWILQRRIISEGNFAKVGTRGAGGHLTTLGPWRWLGRATLLLYILFAAVLPVLALVLVSFQNFWSGDIIGSGWSLRHYERVLGAPSGIIAVKNSLFHGLVTGAITVLAGALLMVYAHRNRNWMGRIAETVGKVPAAISNAVFGVAFILALGGPPFNLGGTVYILMAAFFVVYMPYAAITSETAVSTIDRSLEEAAAVSGARETQRMTSVILPLMTPGLFAAWALVFVRIVGDLPLAVLLGTSDTATIGYLLLDVFEQGTFGTVAALSLMMTAISVPIVLIMLRLGSPRWKRNKPSQRTVRQARASRDTAAKREDASPVAVGSTRRDPSNPNSDDEGQP